MLHRRSLISCDLLATYHCSPTGPSWKHQTKHNLCTMMLHTRYYDKGRCMGGLRCIEQTATCLTSNWCATSSKRCRAAALLTSKWCLQAAPGSAASQQQQMSQQQVSTGGKTPPSQQAAPDRFGLLGLLSVIRMTDPDLTTLALGTDLTTLGLHLNSPENVYKTFQSPWVDNPLRPEPEFKVPACYLHNPPRLQPGYFSKFQQDTLFFIFYSMSSDEAQLFAADELASRGWWFHREGKVWLTRIPNTEPLLKTDRYERGSYYVFDTNMWECVRKDNFHLQYDQLERPPNLPRSAPQPGSSQGTAIPSAK